MIGMGFIMLFESIKTWASALERALEKCYKVHFLWYTYLQNKELQKHGKTISRHQPWLILTQVWPL